MGSFPASFSWPKKLVLATQNKDKLQDLFYLLQDLSTELVSIGEFTQDDVEETGFTYEENALIKARHAFQVTGLPALADDSGFSVHVLNGAPGIYTARWAIDSSGKRNFRTGFDRLEAEIDGRDCTTDYICALAYVDNQGEYTFRGIAPGFLDFSKKDESGFGFCPIFVPTDGNPERLSLGQMSNEKRRSFSGRGRAVKVMLQSLLQSSKA